MAERNATLSARRAYFSEEFDSSLEDLLIAVFQKADKPRDRVYTASSGKSFVFGSVDRMPTNQGIFVRIFEYEEGATGVVDLDYDSKTADIEELLPPGKRHFLLTQIVVLIRKNEIFACGLGNKNGIISQAIRSLGLKNGAISEQTVVAIHDLPASATVEEIRRVGIREIVLPVSDYLQALPPTAGLGSLGAALFERAKDKSVHKKRQATSGRLILKRNRFKKDELRRDEWLTSVGIAAINDDEVESFTIVLESGKKITASRTKRQKVAKLNRFGNTVSYLSAKNAILTFVGELDEDDAVIE
ncbi:hypothetical protein BCF33_0241 [Hasllibacter halocynthiae]|uniref:Uncharacterized protein n=1 Tax=Hasllibacter halocynthiae TaxID=595589 RepID=A0A2T0X6U9_9RHOB|nr:hypothetical protein [Hasllibacter halocynthiae]PRY94647.1 hypothetical protein BCF33_0241 [Hasllibacter halocynthiae]